MVNLIPMTESEFQQYRNKSIENYAQEQVKAGNWDPSEALRKSEEEFLKLLPDGLASPKQHLFSIKEGDSGVNIGLIWFAEKSRASHPSAYIYDFLIFEDYRRKGFGVQALSALENKVKELGIETISLHVFGHNQSAIDLYRKLSYKITDIQMTKKLGE